MKICVFSDSHGSSSKMLAAIEEHSPELIIHLGDGEGDTEKIKSQFPLIPLKAVKGNCDRFSVLPERALIEINGCRIFMTHGHTLGVKGGTEVLEHTAGAAGARLALFGHTHRPLCRQIGDMWLLNPGSCAGSSASFALVTIDLSGSISCEIRTF